ncbi:hypothetical protein NLU14_08810 [Marinobacter sp. 71-i]|uniref:Uncharacterized protein n=1 Tax=Marinobacter iranensis TaxID=2962607 RepID=A0ABT5Y9H4_9GAMM|nr:hypothetical protein [Marinobacter iranensis]MDF0750330.1 hypothetical protein [Marinobacter iranensis]
MNDIDKTIHRILATVREINKRDIGSFDFRVSGYGVDVVVEEWLGTKPGEVLALGRKWEAHDGNSMLARLRKINIDLMRILAEGQAKKVVA